MTMSRDDLHWLAKRQDLSTEQNRVISESLDQFVEKLKEAGFSAPQDDRIAKVEASMIRYLIEAA